MAGPSKARGSCALGALCTLLFLACSSPEEVRAGGTSGDESADGDSRRGATPPFHADFGSAEASAPKDEKAKAKTPVDSAFDARLKKQLRSVVGAPSFDAYDWDALLSLDVPWSGVKVWVPGTGERTADDPDHDPNHRAMGAVPSAFAQGGATITFSAAESPASIGFWLGVSCSQSVGGALFAQRDRLSALDVFTTAWPDALAIASLLGSHIKGAWLVGHSAGALPAVLAGLIGGAHRVDVYGVPSAVGYLDGVDGIVHLHTDPLDPAGAMGSIDGSSGKAQIDLTSAFVIAVKAGGLAHHDYSAWPAPSP